MDPVRPGCCSFYSLVVVVVAAGVGLDDCTVDWVVVVVVVVVVVDHS